MRATNSPNAFPTAAVAIDNNPYASVQAPAIGVRRRRSARAAMGMPPMTNSTPYAPPMAPSTALDTPSESWMSGASTPIATLSRLWTTDTAISATSRLTPPWRKASARLTSSPPTTMRSSSA